MSLNITLLREVQQSIADPTLPFNMNNWCTCIAGHTYRALTGKEPSYLGILDYGGTKALAQALGLDSIFLFTVYNGSDARNREVAISKLEALIQWQLATAQGVAEPAPLVASAPKQTQMQTQTQEEELELVGA